MLLTYFAHDRIINLLYRLAFLSSLDDRDQIIRQRVDTYSKLTVKHKRFIAVNLLARHRFTAHRGNFNVRLDHPINLPLFKLQLI